LGKTAAKLRRELRRHRCATGRDIITYCCLTYAAHLIGTGTKVDAAMRLAGFHNHTNFNRQFRAFLCRLPHQQAGVPWRPLAEREAPDARL
jgi:methylphosphotriester-DNA--protein-cysteine methyltransferase